MHAALPGNKGPKPDLKRDAAVTWYVFIYKAIHDHLKRFFYCRLWLLDGQSLDNNFPNVVLFYVLIIIKWQNNNTHICCLFDLSAMSCSCLPTCLAANPLQALCMCVCTHAMD